MKFSAFKEFRKFLDSDIEDILKYLSTDLTKTLRELGVGLTKLKLTDNFESFQVEVTIPASSELQIVNELKSRLTPTQRIIVRGNDASKDIVDGDTQWNQKYVYLKNTNGSSAATATVVFLR